MTQDANGKKMGPSGPSSMDFSVTKSYLYCMILSQTLVWQTLRLTHKIGILNSTKQDLLI